MNLAHPIGRPKASWFISLGYHPDNPERLESDLLYIVRSSSHFVVQKMRYGIKYIVDGSIYSPNGSLARIRTVWIVEKGLPAPRLVTAYPDEGVNDE